MKSKNIVALLSSIFFMFNTGLAQQKLTYPDLIKRLYDFEYLAKPPHVGEASGNFSSYDRNSKYNPDLDKYENWNANRDGTGFIRKEGDNQVIFEKEGPGVIWRIWSALALAGGNIKIYVDHGTEPIIDMTYSNFFDQINEDGIETPKSWGSLSAYPSVNLPNLMPTLSRGRNRFIPIPYNKHCKIVLEEGWGYYYRVMTS